MRDAAGFRAVVLEGSLYVTNSNPPQGVVLGDIPDYTKLRALDLAVLTSTKINASMKNTPLR